MPTSKPLHALHVYSGNLYGGVERMLATFAGLRARLAAAGRETALRRWDRARLAEQLVPLYLLLGRSR